MTPLRYTTPRHIGLVLVLALALGANGWLLADVSPMSFWGAVLLLCLLPGTACVEWLFQRRELNGWGERLGLGIGLSLALSSVVGLGVHYLPGPMTRLQVWMASDLLVGAFLLLGWLRGRGPRGEAVAAMDGLHPRPTAAATESHPTLLVLVVLGVFLLAVFYRFTWLGYSDFQGDEALVTWSSARAIAGEDDILFLHGKSPAEVLLPAALWALTGQLDETAARFPFALASLGAVLAAYLMGKRLFGQRAGLVAAFLFAINGYLIGFGRVVQYQSLVVLMSMWAVFSAYRALEDDSDAYQVLSALFLGAGLLAHYDVLLVLPVLLYLWAERLRQGRGQGRRPWVVSGAALVLLVLIGAAFYLPFSQDPQFRQMISYLGGTRVGGNLLNNNVRFLLLSGTVYNSTYYAAVILVALLGVLWGAWRWLPLRLYVSGLLLALMVTTVVWPSVWRAGRVNLAALPFVLALAVAWLAPWAGRRMRTLWLWFGVAFVSYVFVLADPQSHVYVIMPAWLLLAAYGLDSLAHSIKSHALPAPPRSLQAVGLVVCAAALLVLAGYPYAVFIRHQPEYLQAYMERALPLYWRPYTRIPGVGKFGFPHRSGWKAVGYLYNTGALSGDYRSNEEEWVTLWYTQLALRSCQPDARYYFVATNPWNAGEVPQDLIDSDYALVSTVTVEGEPRLRLYERKPARAGDRPGAIDVETVEAVYDEGATPGRFVQKTAPQQVRRVDLGDEVSLLGYDLDSGKVLPGGRLELTLYWLAQRPLTNSSYHVFAQLGDGPVWGQSDSVPVCGRLPTSVWRPGKVVQDHHRLDINADTVPGKYRLRVGMYSPETGQRLKPTSDNDGTDGIVLTEVETTRNDR